MELISQMEIARKKNCQPFFLSIWNGAVVNIILVYWVGCEKLTFINGAWIYWIRASQMRSLSISLFFSLVFLWPQIFLFGVQWKKIVIIVLFVGFGHYSKICIEYDVISKCWYGHFSLEIVQHRFSVIAQRYFPAYIYNILHVLQNNLHARLRDIYVCVYILYGIVFALGCWLFIVIFVV